MEKTAKQLISDLRGAGITEGYINQLLSKVESERQMARFVGREEARAKFAKLVKTSDNFNSQFLINWIKKLTF